MYNLFLLGRCNLRCSYCFAEGYRTDLTGRKGENGGAGGVMRLETYARILDFLKKSGVPIVSLIGGEPTLHPEFIPFINLALQKGLTVSVKTNAFWGEKVAEEILRLPADGIHYLLNINSPQALGARRWQRVAENARRMRGRNVDFQFNVYGPDFSWDGFLDLAKAVRPNRIVWSLSNMVKGEGNGSPAGPLAVREQYSKRILAFLVAAGEAGIPTVGVHGVTPCMFFEEDYQTLLAYGGTLESICRPVFDILPDRSVLYCFPMSEHLEGKRLEDFQYMQDMNLAFLKETAFRRSDGFPLDDCFECSFSCALACDGGCLARCLERPGAAPAEDRFPNRIPVRTEKFGLEKLPEGVFLIDADSGDRYPVDPPLAALLEAADGQNTLGALRRRAFGKFDGDPRVEEVFREVVTDFLARGVLALRPYREAGEPRPTP
jgi:MoaA/NifB/PqqE/SkfB family radical SAM enzyme